MPQEAHIAFVETIGKRSGDSQDVVEKRLTAEFRWMSDNFGFELHLVSAKRVTISLHCLLWRQVGLVN